MINVVYALTKNVYDWILPSLKSLARHNPDANVFILAESDELPFQLPIDAKVINVSDQKFFPPDGVNYKNAFTYINFLKVRYPSILPVAKVIHLDIDTIVCDDLSEMFDTDLTEKWVGAVQEYKGKYKPFGKTYYNMGVAVINLEQMRKDNIEQVMQDYLNEVPQPWADQDAWNKYGLEQQKFVPLDIRWNENVMTGTTSSPAIVHFCSIKNWYNERSMFRVEYLDKYKETKCGGYKILIAVPTYENIYPDTFRAIYQLNDGGNELHFEFFRGYDVANARNQIGKATLDGGYDYCLMVDNDEVLPQDALVNLLQSEESYSMGHAVVVGYCLSRPTGAANSSGRTTAFKFGGRDYVVNDAYTANELKEFRDNGITKIQIRGSGLGHALIHRSVFEKMTYPYFKWIVYSEKSQLSEDLYFCEQLPSIKQPIFVDTRVACGHLMRHIDYC